MPKLATGVMSCGSVEDIEELTEEQKREWLALDGFMPEEVHDLSHE